jgi:N-acetylneuraminic acid mutarotase
MTATAVGKKLVVFGGGDGPKYYNDVYVLDTTNFRWSKPRVAGTPPSKRRAHTACLYKNGIYVFGGGDGVRALNDVWRLDVSDTSKMSWKLISSASPSPTPSKNEVKDNKPKARGYHSANMVGSKLIIYGGSDGGECFKDIWILDIDPPPPPPPHAVSNHNLSSPTNNPLPPTPATLQWVQVPLATSHPRLSHTSTLIGSYLFIMGGHDGLEYSSEVLMLNLVTMTWDTSRKIWGEKMSGRGYHGAVLVDGRVFIVGGFDGEKVFGGGGRGSLSSGVKTKKPAEDKADEDGDGRGEGVWMLELGGCSYFSQISCFTIDV